MKITIILLVVVKFFTQVFGKLFYTIKCSKKKKQAIPFLGSLVILKKSPFMIDLVKYFVSTQKAVRLRERQQYVLDVDIKLTKPQIKKLIEEMYSVNVLAVNTHIPPRKKKRFGSTLGSKSNYKRAIITLKSGQKILITKEEEN